MLKKIIEGVFKIHTIHFKFYNIVKVISDKFILKLKVDIHAYIKYLPMPSNCVFLN